MDDIKADIIIAGKCPIEADGKCPLKPKNEWISVSERLPKEGNMSYLVTVDYGKGGVVSCQRFFFNDEIGWNDDCVIAWRPLPEPYIGGDKNEYI